MGVELPVAPVDDVIRRRADGLRVSAEASETLARRIQREGARRAQAAAKLADEDGRKTLMTSDFEAGVVPDKAELDLPIAPVDRVARLDIDDRYRVSMDARIVLAAQLEEYAENIAAAAAFLARHAGRRTIKSEDVKSYFKLKQYFG